MKRIYLTAILLTIFGITAVFAQDKNLKLVFIRHGEKPEKGSNLTCQGLNRSLKLPGVLTRKFGKPDFLFVPALGLGDTTKHSRMFQTIAPLAMQYNMVINTSHKEKEFDNLAAELKSKKGTVIITWEHGAIPNIIKALGITTALNWPDSDYDSIWIVTFVNGSAKLTKDKEGLKPAVGCPM